MVVVKYLFSDENLRFYEFNTIEGIFFVDIDGEISESEEDVFSLSGIISLENESQGLFGWGDVEKAFDSTDFGVVKLNVSGNNSFEGHAHVLIFDLHVYIIALQVQSSPVHLAKTCILGMWLVFLMFAY